MPEEPSGNGQGAASEFAELRGLLVGPEAAQLERLQHRLDDPAARAEELSQVLPEAIRLRAARDQKLRSALNPIVEDAIRVSVQRNPRILADALFPVIGAAVRKSVAAALRGMVQTFNQLLEQSISMRGLRWRFEAWRTGKPFGEIVLLRSMLYRVEQVFLIHRETGLLLQHRVAEGAVIKDAELVSGMLTAIQDFVRDSFGVGESVDLETVQIGEFSVWIQYGPRAILAGVVRGAAPRELQGVFQDALERICSELGPALSGFDGDTSAFAASREYLDACLVGQAPAHERRRPALAWLAAAGMGVLVLLGVWGFLSVREARRWSAYLEALEREPGIVVTTASAGGGKHTISGWRDPLSRDPAELLAAAGLRSSDVAFRWEPYVSAHPAFAAIRDLEARKASLQNQTLHFEANSASIPLPEMSAVRNIAAQIQTLAGMAGTSGKEIRIEILGRADNSGPEQRNARLGEARAQAVLSALVAAGAPRERLLVRGLGTAEPLARGESQEARAFNRSVSLRVVQDRP